MAAVSVTVPTAFADHPNVTRTPSVPLPPSAHPDAINATQALIERLEAHLTPPGPTQDPDWYGWIPLRHDAFLAGMLACRHILGDGHHTFLDVGSGIGTKLIVAHELGFQAHGIERWPAYVHTSQMIAPFAPVHLVSATDHTAYDQFDVVYYYGLAPDQAQDERIKRHVTDHMRPGALFFTARRPFPDWLEHVGGLIWRKPTNA